MFGTKRPRAIRPLAPPARRSPTRAARALHRVRPTLRTPSGTNCLAGTPPPVQLATPSGTSRREHHPARRPSGRRSTRTRRSLAAIVADTNELQSELADGGRTDLLIDAIKAKTDNIPASPAAVGDIPTAGAVADAVLDEATSGHSTAGTVGKALTDILADTNELQSDDYPTSIAAVKGDTAAILIDTAEIGTAGAGLTNINLPNQAMDIVGNITGNLSGSVGSVTGNVGGNVTGSIGSLAAQAKADVNAEADTALTDYDGPTHAEMTSEIGAVETDTQDIQARLPAALTGAGNLKADLLAISGDASAADSLEALMDGIIVGQVNDLSASVTSFAADGFTASVDDHFNGRLITFITGALTGQQTAITDYAGSGQTFTVDALTSAPANDVFFVIS